MEADRFIFYRNIFIHNKSIGSMSSDATKVESVWDFCSECGDRCIDEGSDHPMCITCARNRDERENIADDVLVTVPKRTALSLATSASKRTSGIHRIPTSVLSMILAHINLTVFTALSIQCTPGGPNGKREYSVDPFTVCKHWTRVLRRDCPVTLHVVRSAINNRPQFDCAHVLRWATACQRLHHLDAQKLAFGDVLSLIRSERFEAKSLQTLTVTLFEQRRLTELTGYTMGFLESAHNAECVQLLATKWPRLNLCITDPCIENHGLLITLAQVGTLCLNGQLPAPCESCHEIRYVGIRCTWKECKAPAKQCQECQAKMTIDYKVGYGMHETCRQELQEEQTRQRYQMLNRRSRR